MTISSGLRRRLIAFAAVLGHVACSAEFDVNELPSPISQDAVEQAELVAAVSQAIGRIEGYAVDGRGYDSMAPSIAGTPVSVRVLAAYSYAGEVVLDTATVRDTATEALVWITFDGRTGLRPEDVSKAKQAGVDDTIAGRQWALMILGRTTQRKWALHVSQHFSDRMPMSMAFSRPPSLEEAYMFSKKWASVRTLDFLDGGSTSALVVPGTGSRALGNSITWTIVDSLAWLEAFGRAPVVRYVELPR
jgi:hypothetical protein